jgi:hypothetical protein
MTRALVLGRASSRKRSIVVWAKPATSSERMLRSNMAGQRIVTTGCLRSPSN